MRIFSFGPDVGRQLTEYDSRNTVISRVAVTGGSQVVCMHIGAGGVIGRHPTGRSQLFAVVAGSGWVSGEDGVETSIEAGQAAYWEDGESHESGSDDGMTVIVIQPIVLQPLMPEVG